MECPKDVAQRNSGSVLRTGWRNRAVKITSYIWSGAVSGYAGREHPQAANGGTYKLTSFKPTDILMWETDETRLSFDNFNDAGQNCTDVLEGVSQRHAGGNPSDPTRDVGGGAMVGTFGGTSKLIKWKLMISMIRAQGAARPNDVICGPGF
jgi:hypothetical protein